MAKAPKFRGRKASHNKPLKRGRAYEEAVCDIFRKFSPSARIERSVWVIGPDGRRELDVDIHEFHAGRAVHGVVECKDFNPATTGPVGIAHIDALDSKRRDLHLDFAMVCSNAGFTSDAIRKAKRVGIGLLSAAIKGDSRIRFGVVDEIYIRHVALKGDMRLTLSPTASDLVVPAEGLTFEGRSVLAWFSQRLVELMMNNPIVQGRFELAP